MPSRRAVAFLAGAVLAACSATGDGAAPAPPTTGPSTTGAPTTSTTTAPAPPVSLPTAVPARWSGCGGGFDCARVDVPVDYADSSAGTMSLSLIRRPAGDPSRRIGTLLVNPGGPGASGVRRVRRGFTISPEVAARFDIVGFDPRGIGDSTPVRCGSTVAAFRATDLDPDTPAETAALRGAAQAVAEECVATEGRRLGHLGSFEVAHDLEVIRRSLGEAQVSFVGLSYGTLIGLLWAEAYPGSVRALVLDSVVDPAASGDVTAEAQVAAVDRTVATIDAACSADPRCPVRSAGGVLGAYDELSRRLESGAVAGRGVGPTQLAYAAFSATYDDGRWPQLWRALAQGLAGDLTGVATMARWFTALVDYPSFALVSCLDSPHPIGVEAWDRAATRAAARSPRFGRTASNELLPCATWPQATYRPHRITAPGAPPTLVVGSTGDAATPYAQAVQVADDLESGVLLTVELSGHVAIGDSACTDATVTRYLVDLQVPAPGARC